MKLSDMNLDQATDAMVRIASASSVILEDAEIVKLINDISETEKVSVMEWIPKYIPKIATLALKKHRDDVYEIIGALQQMDKEEVGRMNVVEAISVLKENWTIIRDFFSSSGRSEQMNGAMLA